MFVDFGKRIEAGSTMLGNGKVGGCGEQIIRGDEFIN